MSEYSIHDAVDLIEPEGDALPIVFDSPHSGTTYPDDFAHAVDPFLLHGGEDRFVDDLVIDAPRHGIALIRALFARTYIDPNREPGDLDPELLEENWPEAIETGRHSQRGVGLVFRLIGSGVPIYARRLGATELNHRIENYWRPYHSCLAGRIDALHARHGAVWHVDWHSMLAVGNDLSPDPGVHRPDFVLGDLHGTSCDAEFTDFVASALGDLGYTVGLNEPYAGAHIVEHYGRPKDSRHSIQIEINRGLYMEQDSLGRTDGLPNLRTALDAFSTKLAQWVTSR
jgi:N-formylglutamate deformylase